MAPRLTRFEAGAQTHVAKGSEWVSAPTLRRVSHSSKMSPNTDGREACDVLRAAQEVSEAELGELTVKLATAVLREAEQAETRAERARKRSLSRLLDSAEGQRYALALTDRVYRSQSAGTAMASIIEVAERVGEGSGLSAIDRLGLSLLTQFGSVAPRLVSHVVRTRLGAEASPFVLDARPYELGGRLAELHRRGARVNLNYLGEAALGEGEARRYVETYLALLDRADIDALSVKLSNVYSQIDLLAFEASVDALVGRLAPVLSKAARREKLVYFDMEAYRDLELTYAVFERLLHKPEHRDVQAGLAVQAYLPESLELSIRVLELSRRRRAEGGKPVRLRLVKGANLAVETVEASLHRLPIPIYPNKAFVDANYKRLLSRLLVPENGHSLRLGVGSHNLFDLCYALLLGRHRGAPEMVELEMLEGMAGATGRVLAKLAGGILLYAPCVLPEHFPSAISYLVRRFDENTGRENFLRSSVSMAAGDASFAAECRRFRAALQDADKGSVPTHRTQDRAREVAPTRRDPSTSHFDNEPDTDFTRKTNRDYIGECIRRACAERQSFTAQVAGQDVAGPTSSGLDPSMPHDEAYSFARATSEQLATAIETATRARDDLSRLSAEDRAALLDAVASGLAAARGPLIGLIVKDGGKRAQEADTEVSEAIDLARFYARAYLDLNGRYELAARGPVVVTPPWNFPLAIPLGGCLAAIVAGNPVILKPAPETPLVARRACEICWEAGVARDALQFVPCKDEDASVLITDTRVETVVLTGATSTARKFLRMRPALRLLAETGGKNAAYVSPLSDREQTVAFIVASAFGHAGQKCSALSQLVLHEEVYRDEGFRRLLVDAAASLPVGSAHDPRSIVTPLIRPPRGPLRQVLTEIQPHERWLLEPTVDRSNPHLVSAGILLNVRPGSFAHQTELFGPVLAVLEARDLGHALGIMNGTPYGLTAGFFGLRESEQERFAAEMNAGNLYINRSTTGAVVGRQPFGGRKGSNFGPGAKAGGQGYVAQFCRLGAAKKRQWSLSRLQGKPLPSRADLFPDQPGTRVVGGENFVRYQPLTTAIVVFPGADANDVTASRLAQRISGGPELVITHADSERTLRLLEAIDCTRVRVIGVPPAPFVKVAAQRCIVLLRDPVNDDPRAEVSFYVTEQSISLAYHRHGNLSLGSLSQLRPRSSEAGGSAS